MVYTEAMTKRPSRASTPPTMTKDALETVFAKRAVLASAMSVFARQGIEPTRIEDLLQASKVSRRTFYKWFRSKDEVVSALYEEATGELVKIIESAAKGVGGTALGALRQGLDLYLDFHVDNAKLLRALVERAVQSDSPLAERRRWLQRELVQLLSDASRSIGERRLEPYVFYAMIGALEGLSLHLLGQKTIAAADVARAKTTMHALLDHCLGVPHPAPFPTLRG